MPWFEKKPVWVEATQWDGSAESAEAICAWAEGAVRYYPGRYYFHETEWTSNVLGVRTLEGMMLGRAGDWILRGIQGEFYPCKADIFEATYARVSGP